MTAVAEAPEAQPEPTQAPARITRVEDLDEETRVHILAERTGGATLAELKSGFNVSGEVIRAVLPDGNARERTTRTKARTGKEAAEKSKPVGGKVTESKQGIGGRSGEAKSNPKPKAEEPQPAAAPRYVDKAEAGPLSDRVLAARKVLGRKDLSAALGISESTCWRAEQGRIHPAEVQPLTEAVGKVEERIRSGEFQKEARQPKAAAPNKSDLTHMIEATVQFVRAAQGDKRVTKTNLIEAVLAVLDPQVEEPRQVCAVCGTGWPVGVEPPAHSTPGGEGPAGSTHEFVLKSNETA
jgi:hypothetical protein